jgi:molecular chaperone GrpE
MIIEDQPNVPPADNGATPAAGAVAEDAQTADLKARVEQAERAAAAAKDQYLRAIAEVDNVRKRAQREIETANKYGAERVLSDLLDICDSMELGIKAAESPEANVRALVDGMKLTHKQLISFLEKHGVKQVDPKGELFNPDLHEAVAALESPTVPPNHVIDVMQKGYRYHERTLRPAMVAVAKAAATSS